MLEINYPTGKILIIRRILHSIIMLGIILWWTFLFVEIKFIAYSSEVFIPLGLILIFLFISHLFLRIDILYKIKQSIKVDPLFDYILVGEQKYFVNEILKIDNPYSMYPACYRIQFKDSGVKNIYFINTSYFVPLLYCKDSKVIEILKNKIIENVAS